MNWSPLSDMRLCVCRQLYTRQWEQKAATKTNFLIKSITQPLKTPIVISSWSFQVRGNHSPVGCSPLPHPSAEAAALLPSKHMKAEVTVQSRKPVSSSWSCDDTFFYEFYIYGTSVDLTDFIVFIFAFCTVVKQTMYITTQIRSRSS